MRSSSGWATGSWARRRLDRGAIASVVFNDAEALCGSSRSCTRSSRAEYLAWRDQLGALADPPRVCVTEVPLLYEAGSETRFDKVVVVTAPPRLGRARSDAAAAEREQRLLPDEEKVARADYAYVNTGSLDELDASSRR